MKKITTFLAICCTVLFASCNNNQRIQVVESSVYLSDSLSTVDTDRSIFSSANKKLNASLDELNNRIDLIYVSQSDTLQKRALQDADFIDYGMHYELIIQDSVFMATSDLISVRILSYTYTGGAHGNSLFTAINYAPQTSQFLTTANILNMNNTAEINQLLAKHFENKENCFWEEPTLEKASAINIGRNFITFIYDQYVLGAYACGPAVVNIPLAEIEPYMVFHIKK